MLLSPKEFFADTLHEHNFLEEYYLPGLYNYIYHHMNKKDKIFIILVSEFPPGQNGGISHWANNLYTSLDSSGIKVIVLTRKTRSHRKLNIRSTKTLKYISGHSWQKMSWLYILPYLLPVLATHKHVTVIAAT